MKFFSILVFSFISVSAFAGESGYLINGKNYVVFKDGVQVMDPAKVTAARKPSNFSKNNYSDNRTMFQKEIKYEEDPQRGVTCYFIDDSLSCVKTK